MLNYFDYTFFRYALAGLVATSVVGAMIGTYVATRRMVSITGGITHACFGGLGLGYFLGVSPLLTAALFAVASALGVEALAVRYRVREDSAIAVVWALGMAVGILLVFLTPGYAPELNSFLFGNVLTVSPADLLMLTAYAAVMGAMLALRRRLVVACAFDPDFARVAGLPARRVNTVMTVLVAVGIVLTIRLVGIMLLLAVLTLPVMAAELWCRRFATVVLMAAAVGIVSSVAGLLLAAAAAVPCSAMIVLLQAALYLAARAASAATLRRRAAQ